MPKLKLTIVMAVLVLFLVILIRLTYAAPAIPWCTDVKNDHYSGPCVSLMVDGVITGDEVSQ